MKKALLLLLLILPVPVQAQTVLWFSGCEVASGTALHEEYSASGGLIAMTCQATCAAGGGTDPGPKTGNYCLQTNGIADFGASAIDGLAASTIYSRFYYNWSSLPGPFPIWAAFKAASANSLRLYISNTTQKLFFALNNATPITTGATVLSKNVWYLIEVKGVVSATVGGIEVKINGSTEFTSLTTNTSSVTAIDSVNFGWNFGTGSLIASAWDDMMVCSGAYCPTGRSIARQGTSGSPTYTAWTPNSCTSNLIENCWSQTGYDASKNASSATASAAQTMLVHDFGTTQTGHGTQTIGNASTINACKTAVVMKSGTASAPISIRRRLSGADTDTSKTLTTSDAYYDDGIWTTTAGVLRGPTMEIGVVHGTGTATDTVEDMWLLCDYLDATAAIRHRVTQDGN